MLMEKPDINMETFWKNPLPLMQNIMDGIVCQKQHLINLKDSNRKYTILTC